MKLSQKLVVSLATLGPLGLLPASGTFGSLVALFFSWMLCGYWWYPLFVVGAFIASWYSVGEALKVFNEKDPSKIIIDEFVGCLVVFVWVSPRYELFIIGFFLFRFFDITKSCGVAWFEGLGKTSGVLLDDCFAGLLTNIILCIILMSNVI